jgi:cytochrome c oxidase subunit IV
MIFVRYTIILLFMFVLGGFIGAVFSGMLRDSVKGEETKLTFQGLAKR